MDGAPLNYDGEWETIQSIWQQVSELFRPFNVDVTTEDPGLDGIINSGGDDQEWGVRILIGGSTFDWFQPDEGLDNIISATGTNSFGSAQDVPAFVFAADIDEFSAFVNIDRTLGLLAAHEAGVTLGLSPDGQYRSYVDITKDAKRDDDVFVTVHDIYFSGHGRFDDAFGFLDDEGNPIVDEEGNPIGDPGNPYWSPWTAWGPIMGNGSASLLQWSKGEYYNADNVQDDLAIIASEHNGFGYRDDDHGDTLATSDPLQAYQQPVDPENPTRPNSSTVTLVGDGIIGQHPTPLTSDVDAFNFTVDALGEIVSLDINPFIDGAALDILAKLYTADGTLIGTSNPLTELAAGSSTFFSMYSNHANVGLPIPDGGWRVQLDPNAPTPTYTDAITGDVYGVVKLQEVDPFGEWTQVSKLILAPGTYYVTVEGTGKAVTYLDGTDDDWIGAQLLDLEAEPRTLLYDSKLHPGPIYRLLNDSSRPKTAVGYYRDVPDPDDPEKTIKEFRLAPLPLDNSDYGYSNYGSLGYYSVVATMSKGLVVGVDFDTADGDAPVNWNSYIGGDTSVVLTDLISEAGASVPYTLTITSNAGPIQTTSSTVNTEDVPHHAIPLDELGGYITADDTTTTTFVWGGLEAWSYHTIYIFGHAGVDAKNHIVVTGGNLNGTIQSFAFDQTITPDGLVVNNGPLEGQEPTDDLTTFALKVLSDANGEIKIDVTSPEGFTSAIAGLAIAPTRPIGPPQNGSIAGQKWNDDDGNKLKDPGEEGLGGWIIYLDQNNNGILDSITADEIPGETVTLNSSQAQAIPDNNNSGIKSAVEFTGGGTIADISVTVNISHTYVSDLEITLISPTGLRIPLAHRLGDDGDNYTNTVFRDSAATSIMNANAPFTGTFRPQVSLLNGNSGQNIAGLLGTDAHGIWQLEVKDLALDDTGVLNNWSLQLQTATIPGTIEFTEPYRITDANGNYLFEDVEPGLYYVREYIQPSQAIAGWRQTWAPTPITVTSGANLTDLDFGNWIPDVLSGSIQGQKFYDGNQNGVKDPGEAGMAGWIVYLDANGNGVRDVSSTATVVSSTNVPLNILDLKTTQSQIMVGNLGSVFDITVTLDITHSFVGDLDVYLTSPSGRQVKLFAGVGGQYNDFHDLTLSDDASRSISDINFNDLPYTGTWRPEGPLSFLNGEDAAGIWTLSISDTFAGDQGTLNSWSLSFNSGESFRITDADGNYKFDNVAAGAYIIREEGKPGWNQTAPAVTTIPGAVWSDSQWAVTVNALEVFNVENVNFSASSAAGLPGDYDRNGTVDTGDYIVWRRQSGSSVANFTGADGNGDGLVDQADFAIWRQHYGESLFGSGAGSGLADVSSGAATQTVQADADEPASPAAGLAAMPESTEQISLVSQPVTVANASAPTVPAASPVAVGQLYAVAGITTSASPERGTVIRKQSLRFSSHSDLGLLAWLASSSGTSQSQAASTSSADENFSTDFANDDSDSLDAAFELLEGNALVSAAI